MIAALNLEQQVTEYMERNLVASDEAELHCRIRIIVHDPGKIPPAEELLRLLAKKNVRSSEAKIKKALRFMGWDDEQGEHNGSHN